RGKLHKEGGLAAAAVDAVFHIVEHRSLDALARAYDGVQGVAEELARLERYFEHLDAMGLGDFVVLDPTIVRGLAYYTGTVFEIFDRAGRFRAICGGGRYDNLLRAVSGADLPALGFGMGDVVLTEILTERNLLPPLEPRLDYYIVTVSEAERALMLQIARRLREAGHSVAYSLRPSGVGRQFKDADARGAGRVIVLGPDEVAQGIAVVREMSTGEERRVPLDE